MFSDILRRGAQLSKRMRSSFVAEEISGQDLSGVMRASHATHGQVPSSEISPFPSQRKVPTSVYPPRGLGPFGKRFE